MEQTKICLLGACISWGMGGGRETEKETDKEMGKKIKRVRWGQVWRKINQGRGPKVREQVFMIIES